MSHNISSIVANLLSKHSEISKAQIFAAVRLDDRFEALSALGFNVSKIDLSDEQSILDELYSHKSRNLLRNTKYMMLISRVY
jgi:hypothetical protein